MLKGHAMLADPKDREDGRGICWYCMSIFQPVESCDAFESLSAHSQKHKDENQNEPSGVQWSRRKYYAIRELFADRLRPTEIVDDFKFLTMAEESEYISIAALTDQRDAAADDAAAAQVAANGVRR